MSSTCIHLFTPMTPSLFGSPLVLTWFRYMKNQMNISINLSIFRWLLIYPFLRTAGDTQNPSRSPKSWCCQQLLTGKRLGRWWDGFAPSCGIFLVNQSVCCVSVQGADASLIGLAFCEVRWWDSFGMNMSDETRRTGFTLPPKVSWHTGHFEYLDNSIRWGKK